MEIGNKIRQLRIQFGLTQEELADRCELSKGFISMLENDLTSPSISTMQDLLEVFGLSISDFFSSIEDTVEKSVVYTSEDYAIQNNDGYDVEFLISDAQAKELEPLKVIIEPGKSTEELMPHEGDMFGYVLEGSIKLHLNDTQYKVKAGESFYYSKPVAKQFIENSSKSNYAKLLWISTPPVF